MDKLQILLCMYLLEHYLCVAFLFLFFFCLVLIGESLLFLFSALFSGVGL